MRRKKRRGKEEGPRPGEEGGGGVEVIGRYTEACQRLEQRETDEREEEPSDIFTNGESERNLTVAIRLRDFCQFLQG